MRQDQFDRMKGQGKYATSDSQYGVPEGSVGNPILQPPAAPPLGIRGAIAPWSGSNKSFREWKSAKMQPGGSTGYGRTAQMANFWNKFPGMSQPYLDQMDQLKEDDEAQKIAEEQFKAERISNALEALRNGAGGQSGSFPAINILRRGNY